MMLKNGLEVETIECAFCGDTCATKHERPWSQEFYKIKNLTVERIICEDCSEKSCAEIGIEPMQT